VFDIRHAEEFEPWHILGSENIDVYYELQDDPDSASDALLDLQNGRDVVTVCAAGVVSEQATKLLTELGYSAKTLVDGMAGWSRVHLSAPVHVDIDGTLVQVARPGKGCLSYVLISDGEAAVFDPSHYPEEYEDRLEEYGADLVGVFDTHAHADHVSGGRTLADRTDVPYHLHPADATEIDATSIEDGQTITVGTVDVSVIHTPGHSPGGVTYSIAGEALLTGDTLFHQSVGRVELGVEAGIEETDIEENAATLFASLQRLSRQDGDPLVLPAHDPGSPVPPVAARMSEVEDQNDDLRLDREAFVEKLADDIPDHPPNFERVKRANIGLASIDDDELSALELGPNRCAAE
jgi:glyoxylase-like metal-dependent hydrolase (beta-lactamase superfamily II)